MKKTILPLAMLAFCGFALAGPLDEKLNTYNAVRANKSDTSTRDTQNPPLGAGGPAKVIGLRDPRIPAIDQLDTRYQLDLPLGAGGPAPFRGSRDAKLDLPLGAGGPAPFKGSRDAQK